MNLHPSLRGRGRPLVVEDPDPPPPEPPELPEPPPPGPVPVEPRSAPVVEPRPEFDPTEEPVLGVSASSALFNPWGADGSLLAEAGAAGVASGPLVRVARPPATPETTPERLAPNPIRTATVRGTAQMAAPAIADDAVRRCHKASSPLPIKTVSVCPYPGSRWINPGPIRRGVVLRGCRKAGRDGDLQSLR